MAQLTALPVTPKGTGKKQSQGLEDLFDPAGSAPVSAPVPKGEVDEVMERMRTMEAGFEMEMAGFKSVMGGLALSKRLNTNFKP